MAWTPARHADHLTRRDATAAPLLAHSGLTRVWPGHCGRPPPPGDLAIPPLAGILAPVGQPVGARAMLQPVAKGALID